MSADDELLNRGLYEGVFLKIQDRLRQGKILRHSYALYPDLNLQWVLSHKKQLIDIIIESIKKNDFEFDVIKHSVIFADKSRDIYIAAWPERILMLALGQILSTRLSSITSKNVYSFQKGRGAHEAVRNAASFINAHKSQPLYVLKRDISKYGDSIPQPKLFAALEQVTDIVRSPLFYKLVKAAIRVPFKRSEDAPPACLCVGLPSGSPLVPPLENFYLSPLDRKLENIANSFYGRYGDDIIFITPDRAIADWAQMQIAETASNLGLEIKPQKLINACVGFSRNSNDDGYVHRTHITWLGFSLTNHGLIGIKPNHLELVLSTLKKEISGLFIRARRSNIPIDDQYAVIKAGLQKLLQRNAPRALSSYIYYHEDHLVYRLIDRRVVQIVFECLVREFGLKRRDSWRALRCLKIPSTYYLRFLADRTRKRVSNGKSADTIAIPVRVVG